MNKKKLKVTAVILSVLIVIAAIVIAVAVRCNFKKFEANNSISVSKNETSESDKTEQSEKSETDNLNSKTIYAEVLENYKQTYLTADREEYSVDPEEDGYNTDIINSLIIMPGYSPEVLYYSFEDLSDDGIPELILCNEYDKIYDIFGYENGEVKRLFELSDFLLNRADFQILDSNTIRFDVYPAVRDCSIHFYKLAKGTAVPEEIQTIYTEEPEYFEGIGVRTNKIYEDEYNTILDSYGETMVLQKHILAVKKTEDS